MLPSWPPQMCPRALPRWSLSLKAAEVCEQAAGSCLWGALGKASEKPCVCTWLLGMRLRGTGSWGGGVSAGASLELSPDVALRSHVT